MNEGPSPASLGLKRRGFKAFLVLLYALTFYLGPQFAGIDIKKNPGPGFSGQSGGPASGSYLINLFNQRFELNDL